MNEYVEQFKKYVANNNFERPFMCCNLLKKQVIRIDIQDIITDQQWFHVVVSFPQDSDSLHPESDDLIRLSSNIIPYYKVIYLIERLTD